jgi:hypothetical protein
VGAVIAGGEAGGGGGAGVLAGALVLMRAGKELRAVRERWSWRGGARGRLAVVPGAAGWWLFAVAGRGAAGVWRAVWRGMVMFLRAG